MKRENGDLILFKIVGVGLVLFYLFVFIGVNFVTVGVDSKEKPKTVQTESAVSQEGKLRTDLHDGTILGKFWNSKGHFIVVYDDDTKAPIIFNVDVKEWETMRIGETY